MTISCNVDNKTSNIAKAKFCRVCGLLHQPLLTFALDSMIPGPRNKVDYLHLLCGKVTSTWEILSWGDAHKRWSMTVDSSLLNKALEISRFAINPLNYSKVFLAKDIKENLIRLGLPIAKSREMKGLESTNINANTVSSRYCQNVTTQQTNHHDFNISTSSSLKKIKTDGSGSATMTDKKLLSYDVSNGVKQNQAVTDDTRKVLKHVTIDLTATTSDPKKMKDRDNEKTSVEKNTIADKTISMSNNNTPMNTSSQIFVSATLPQLNSFQNIQNPEKYYAIKVPDNIKPGDKMVVSLPDESVVEVEYPTKLQNANFEEAANSTNRLLLLVNPNISTKATVTATATSDTITSSVMATPTTTTTSSTDRRTSARKSAERLRVGHNSYPLQVCNRTNSRIGKLYQIEELPFARKTDVFKCDA